MCELRFMMILAEKWFRCSQEIKVFSNFSSRWVLLWIVMQTWVGRKTPGKHLHEKLLLQSANAHCQLLKSRNECKEKRQQKPIDELSFEFSQWKELKRMDLQRNPTVCHDTAFLFSQRYVFAFVEVHSSALRVTSSLAPIPNKCFKQVVHLISVPTSYKKLWIL